MTMARNAIEVTLDWGMRARRAADGHEIKAGGGWVAGRVYERLVTPWLPVDSGDPAHDSAPRYFWVAPGLRDPDSDAGLLLTVTTPGRGAGRGHGMDATVYLHARWDEVAKTRTTYGELAEAALYWADELAKEPPPKGDIHGFRATLPPMDPRALASLITRLELERVAGVAALVLEGRVTPLALSPRHVDGVVVGTDEDIPARVEWFDAVAALLPYGNRADLSVSTGALVGGRHRLRFAAPGERQVSTNRSDPLPPKPSGVAEEYRALLVELHDRHALDDVIRYLSTLDGIRLSAGPEPALAALLVFDEAHQVWRAVAERRPVGVDRIRAVLDDPIQRDKIPPTAVRDLARALLVHPAEQDADLLAAHLRNSQPSYLVDAVEKVIAASDRKTSEAAWLLSVADRVGMLEALLDELLQLAPRFSRRRRRRKHDRVLAVVADGLQPPEPDAWEILRSTLRRDLLTAFDLVEKQLLRPRGVVAAMRTTAWLAAGPGTVPKELTLLDELVRGDADEHAVELARQTWLPERAGRLARVLQALGRPDDLELLWARRQAGHRDPVDRATLDSLAEAYTGVTEVVRLDLLGLLGDGRPLRDLDRRLEPFAGAVRDYGSEFTELFWSLTDDDRWAASRRIAEHLNGLAWHASLARAALVITLLHELKTHPAVREEASWSPQHFLDVVDRGVAANPEIEGLEVYRTLWLGDGAAATAQPSDPDALIEKLRRGGDDLDLTTFVLRVATVLQYDDAEVTDALFRALRGSRHLATGLDIRDFLIHVWQKLPPPESGDRDEVYWDLGRRVHRGGLGADAAREYGRHVRRTAPEEFRRWSQELYEAGTPTEEIERLLKDVADESWRRGRSSDADDPADEPDDPDDPEEAR